MFGVWRVPSSPTPAVGGCLQKDKACQRRAPSQGFRFRISFSGIGLWVSIFNFRNSGFEFRDSGSGFRVPGFGYQDPDFGFRVPGTTFCNAEMVRPDECAITGMMSE